MKRARLEAPAKEFQVIPSIPIRNLQMNSIQSLSSLRIIGPSYRGVWICIAGFRDLRTPSFEIPWFLGFEPWLLSPFLARKASKRNPGYGGGVTPPTPRAKGGFRVGGPLEHLRCAFDWHIELRFTGCFYDVNLQGTNISPKNGILEMIFLFPRWDMLIPWRVISWFSDFPI